MQQQVKQRKNNTFKKNKFPNASFDSPLYPKVVSFNLWFKSMKPSRFVLFLSIHTISHLLLVSPAFLFSLSQQTTLFGRPLVTLPIAHHHHHPDPFDQEKQTAVDVFALDAWRRRTVEASGTDPRIAQVVPDRRARTESNADAVLHTLAGRTQVRKREEKERELMRVYSPNIHKGRWTEEEDNILRYSVLEYANVTDTEGRIQPIPWNKIAERIPNRTGIQCQARWTEALDPYVRKGKWAAEEDALLRMGVESFGTCWIRIAETIPGRTQVRTGGVQTGHWRACRGSVVRAGCRSSVKRIVDSPKRKNRWMMSRVISRRTMKTISSSSNPSLFPCLSWMILMLNWIVGWIYWNNKISFYRPIGSLINLPFYNPPPSHSLLYISL